MSYKEQLPSQLQFEVNKSASLVNVESNRHIIRQQKEYACASIHRVEILRRNKCKHMYICVPFDFKYQSWIQEKVNPEVNTILTLTMKKVVHK